MFNVDFNFVPCNIFLTFHSNLLQICVDLWATGDRSLSSHSFLMIRDIASVCTSNWLNICFVKTYKAFTGRSPSEHTHFLRNSFVELCCLDVQKSSNKAMICIRRLGDILLKGWQTKKKVSFKQF
jgi:nucleolar complex protein 2